MNSAVAFIVVCGRVDASSVIVVVNDVGSKEENGDPFCPFPKTTILHAPIGQCFWLCTKSNNSVEYVPEWYVPPLIPSNAVQCLDVILTSD